MAIKSQQIFAQAQNFLAITVLEPMWEWNEITIKFELRWKNGLWNGAQVSLINFITSLAQSFPKSCLFSLS